MTARLIAQGPFADNFERRVARRLVHGLGPDDIVVTNLNLRGGAAALSWSETDGLVISGTSITIYEAKRGQPPAGTPADPAADWGQRSNPFRQLAARSAGLRRELDRAGLSRFTVHELAILGDDDPVLSGPRATEATGSRNAAERLHRGAPAPPEEVARLLDVIGCELSRKRIGPVTVVEALEPGVGYRAYRGLLGGQEVYCRVLDAVELTRDGDVARELRDDWIRRIDAVHRGLIGNERIVRPIPLRRLDVEAIDRLVVAYNWCHERPLRSLVKHGPLSPAEALHWLERIGAVLDGLPDGWVLRHLSPDGISLDGDDVWVLGLELAHLQTVRTPSTALFEIAARSPYCAPEVRDVSVRHSMSADIYTLAAIAVLLMTGDDPPLDDPPDLHALPPAIVAVLARSLHAERETDRPPDAATFLQELRDAIVTSGCDPAA